MTGLGWLGVVACTAASIPAGLRWLRVIQREHYLPGSTVRFAVRWWRTSPLNLALVAIGLLGAVAALWFPGAALVSALVAACGPRGLSIRGRTSRLAWTRRLKTVAALACLLEVIVIALGAALGVGAGIAGLGALGLPLLVDAAARLLDPVERRLSERFIEQAADRLRKVGPRVVGITGSYGKTSTKNHLTALVATDRSVVPSPRSFNNRAGLARAINEHLAAGTDVFIAEMGTYGPGEIADMVAWCPPEIAVITAIGPVHLERFGSLEVTLASKAEITRTARTVVLNVDDPMLDRLARSIVGVTVVRASATDPAADVSVVPGADGWSVSVRGEVLGQVPAPAGVQPSNVACALGAALALGVDPATAAHRVGSLSAVENRQSVGRAPSGVTVVDDTFNANPAGAAAALELLGTLEITGRRIVVTPGMIELGERQGEENAAFAERVASSADGLVVVGRTNAAALLAGVRRATSGIEVVELPDRTAAVAWVRANLGREDAVLYENDLPDHYP